MRRHPLPIIVSLVFVASFSAVLTAAPKLSRELAKRRISQLVEEVPEISELDLNPIFALPPGDGCRVVDARIQVRQPG